MQGPMSCEVCKWGFTAYCGKTQPGEASNTIRTLITIVTSRQVRLTGASRKKASTQLLHLPGQVDTTHTALLQCRQILPFLDNVVPKLYVTGGGLQCKTPCVAHQFYSTLG